MGVIKNILLGLFMIGMLGVLGAQTAKVYPTKNFDRKGFYLDLRNEVMTVEAIKKFTKEIASMGLNTLVLEYEATYPYLHHATISNEVAYSRSEIQSLITYAASLGVEIIPVQECFGHVQYILRHDRYNHLSEDPKDNSQVCPLKIQADSLLFQDLFADMAAMHPSQYIHIGGDETYLLGHDDTCSAFAQKEGKSKLFVNYMKVMSEIVIKLGKTPVMWADMILKYPEAADLLPKQTILMDWNYGWKPNHFGDIGLLQQKGFKFWGASSIRSHPDNWYVTDWMTHFRNQRDYIPFARNRGYESMFVTSWSTSGLYSFTWDVGNDVLDMQPIRNNYPLSGYRILVAAYVQSLKQSQPLDGKNFVLTYAKERFGLSESDGNKLWDCFQLAPELLVHGKPTKSTDIATMIRQNDKVREILHDINPKANEIEIQHFRLMADLRDYYLHYKAALARYNAPDFEIDSSNNLLPDVEALVAKGKELDRRFSTLNKGFLKYLEIKKQNKVRDKVVLQLLARLRNLKP